MDSNYIQEIMLCSNKYLSKSSLSGKIMDEIGDLPAFYRRPLFLLAPEVVGIYW